MRLIGLTLWGIHDLTAMNFLNRLWRNRRTRLLALLGAILLPVMLAIAPAWTSESNSDFMTIEPQEVVSHDLYLRGDRVMVDGTVQGNTFAAGNQVIINGTVEDDVYLAGEEIIIDGTIQGDAILAGRFITISGNIVGDINAAGQSIVINGLVEDDVRIAAEVIKLNDSAQVADDLVAAAFSLETGAGSTVGGNLSLATGQALLEGTVAQNVVGGAGSLLLRGIVGEDMVVTVGNGTLFRPPFIPEPAVEIPDVPVGLTLTNAAQVGGDLNYRAPEEATLSDGAQVLGEVEYSELATQDVTVVVRPIDVILNTLQRFLTLALVGWLLLRFLPDWTQNLTAILKAKPWASLGWGVVMLVLVGVVAIAILIAVALLVLLLAFTLQGLILPVLGIGTLANLSLLISFGIFVSYVPQVVLSYVGGRWLMQKLRPRQTGNDLTALLLGLAIFVILTTIPVVGGILTLAAVLLGLGALGLWGKPRLSRKLA